MTECAMSETYRDVEHLLWHCCWEFAKANPSRNFDLDELFSQASLTFVDAYRQYDSEKNDSFVNYLAICVKRRLYYWFVVYPNRKKRRRNEFQFSQNEDLRFDTMLKDTFHDLSSIWCGLSEDASRIIRLALDSKPVTETLSKLSRHFESLGWSKERFDDGVSEIREALEAA